MEFSDLLTRSLLFVLYLTPFWLTPLLVGWFWNLWVGYVRDLFISSQKWVLLEIRLPKEVFKSPLAMELILQSFYQTGSEGTVIDKYWKGGVRTWFSLELASINGNVGFFIWTNVKNRNLIEAQIYSQYPGIEIHEAKDYTAGVEYDPATNDVYACDFEKVQPSPFPIKTYVDYALEKDPKEEFKNDPLSSLLETLGTLKQGEQMWIQIIIRAHKKEKRWHKSEWKAASWSDEAKDVVKKIIADATIRPEEDKTGKVINLSKGQADIIGAIEKNLTKVAFDTGIRVIYVADKKVFSGPGMMLPIMSPFSTGNMNALKPVRWLRDFSYPWQDFRGYRQDKVKRAALMAYKLRSFFHPPFKTKNIVMSTEELATMYHFPGGTASAPTMSRILSKKSEPPANLPI